jgi:hypothetical protein
MSIQEKIDNAKPTSWPAEGLSTWEIKILIFKAELKIWSLKSQIAWLKFIKRIRERRNNHGTTEV